MIVHYCLFQSLSPARNRLGYVKLKVCSWDCIWVSTGVQRFFLGSAFKVTCGCVAV